MFPSLPLLPCESSVSVKKTLIEKKNSLICFSAYINHIYVIYSKEVLGFLISSFASLYFCDALFIETNSLRLMYELIKAFEIKILIAFNLLFASSTILSCFFFFFLIIDLYFLSPAIIAQIFNPTADPIEMLTKEAKVEI